MSMQAKPRLLDLFCCAGGAARGYQQAGFHVTGVDINPQPRYGGDTFIQSNALEYLLKHGQEYDVIHASPPCQHYSSLTRVSGKPTSHPALIPGLREMLFHVGKPYVIENVPGAPLINPVTLCGSYFNKPLRRHRLFESNMNITGTPCQHDKMPRNIEITNRGKKLTWCVPVYGSTGGKAPGLWNTAMDIDWMTPKELAQAIPPYYTKHIGSQIISQL